jgi:hypothetical protein
LPPGASGVVLQTKTGRCQPCRVLRSQQPQQVDQYAPDTIECHHATISRGESWSHGGRERWRRFAVGRAALFRPAYRKHAPTANRYGRFVTILSRAKETESKYQDEARSLEMPEAPAVPPAGAEGRSQLVKSGHATQCTGRLDLADEPPRAGGTRTVKQALLGELHGG